MISIVPMKLIDLNAVYAIEKECFSIPWSRESLKAEITSNNIAIYIVAKKDSQVLGYAGMRHVVTEGHITNIAVKPEHQGRGVGEALLKEIIHIARKKNMVGLSLEARMGNRPAMNLYSKYGFKAEGIRKGYYSDTGEDAVVMWKDL